MPPDMSEAGMAAAKKVSPVPKKRSVISLACTACRKRKTKCDGHRPTCTECANRGKSDGCVYDESADKRRTSHLRQRAMLMIRLKELETLVQRIKRGGPEAELAIREIRRRDSLDGSVAGDLPSSEVITPEETDSKDDIEPKWKDESSVLTLDEEGQVHYFGGTSNLPELKHSMTVTGRASGQLPQPGLSIRSLYHPSNGSPNGNVYRVQNVDIPHGVIRYLLDLYFCWQHTYYNIFDKDRFLRDLNTEGKFYSEFLLNAVLAHAAQLSDLPILRSHPSDPSTSGYMFFNEARSLIDSELLKRSVTTVQGLLLLASREAGVGRDTVGWVYSGMAFRMALDLGLHLDCRTLMECGYLLPDDYVVRNASFWGCYLFDQGWSTYLGRPSAIHMTDVTVERRSFIADEAPVSWVPLLNPEQRGKPLPHYPENTLTAILRLSEIIEETLGSLYTPKRTLMEDGTDKVHETVKQLFSKLQKWESALPLPMTEGPGSDHPSVLLLFTLFHATKIFLFRPFVKVNKNEAVASCRPMNLCVDAAMNIIEKLERFRSLYPLRLATNMSVYVTFTAATVFLLRPGIQLYDQKLDQCLRMLDEIGQSWKSATTVAEGIRARMTVKQEAQLFLPYPMGPSTYFETKDSWAFDAVPEFEFLMELPDASPGTVRS